MKKIMIAILMSLIFFGCSKKEESTINKTQEIKEVNKVLCIAKIEPASGLVKIYAGANGRIESFNFTENSIVKKGQVIVNLNCMVENAQLQQAKARRKTQETVIKSFEAKVAASKLSLEKAKTDYELNVELFEIKAKAESDVYDSKITYEKAKVDLEQAQADLQQNISKLSEYDSEINYYKQLVDQKAIKAPYNGKILSWDNKIGDYVNDKSQIGQFAPSGNLVAVTEVDEIFAERVRDGMSAVIKSQATGEVLGKGEVFFTSEFLKKKSIFSDESTQEDRRIREVKIKLDSDSKAIINSRVDCEIYIK